MLCAAQCQFFHTAYPSPPLPAITGRTPSLLILGRTQKDRERFSSLSKPLIFLYNCSIHYKHTSAVEHSLRYLHPAFQILASFAEWDLTSMEQKGKAALIHRGCINMVQIRCLEPLLLGQDNLNTQWTNLPLITNPPPAQTTDPKFSQICPDGTHCFEASSQSSLNWKYEVSQADLVAAVCSTTFDTWISPLPCQACFSSVQVTVYIFLHLVKPQLSPNKGWISTLQVI